MNMHLASPQFSSSSQKRPKFLFLPPSRSSFPPPFGSGRDALSLPSAISLIASFWHFSTLPPPLASDRGAYYEGGGEMTVVVEEEAATKCCGPGVTIILYADAIMLTLAFILAHYNAAKKDLAQERNQRKGSLVCSKGAGWGLRQKRGWRKQGNGSVVGGKMKQGKLSLAAEAKRRQVREYA